MQMREKQRLALDEERMFRPVKRKARGGSNSDGEV